MPQPGETHLSSNIEQNDLENHDRAYNFRKN